MSIAAPPDSADTARICQSYRDSQGFVMKLSRAWGRTLASEAGSAGAAAVIGNEVCEGLGDRDRALANWARRVVADPNATTPADVEALRRVGLGEREIFEVTVFIAFRLAFSTVNVALGLHPGRRAADLAPAEVRQAVGFGRPVASP